MRIRVVAALLFLATLAVAVGLVAIADRLERKERRQAAVALARSLATSLEQELTAAVAAPTALGAVVAHTGEAGDFEHLAEELRVLSPSIDSLQLAPDGVLRYIHPLPGNEPALGLDLMREAAHRPYIDQAIATRKVVVAGPFQLRQGGTGLAARYAVFTHHGPRGERFWGVASAIIRLPKLLAACRVDRLGEAGYEHQLVRTSPLTGARERIDGSPAALRDPVLVEVRVAQGDWTLAVVPRGGWGPSVRVAAGYWGAFLGALVVSLLTLRLLQEPERLRRLVAARTAELEQAHREQRLAEASARQSQKLEAIGLLAGGVAHDFNNLLVGILGYADLIEEEARPGTTAAEGAKVIGQAARRAAELTRQLLAFARKGKQREEPVDLHALVDEVSTLLRRTLSKQIEVARIAGARPPYALGDPSQLQQLALNLAVNARDAMPEGGTLTIETGERELTAAEAGAAGLAPGRYVLLAVADTGVGMPPEVRERIFEPFFTTKEEGRGTGMGLAMVYGIVKSHGGAIRVESAVGKGSRFEVLLPASEAPARKAAPARTLPGRGRVVVVDDEEVVRQTAGRLLQELGYQPLLLPGGQQAVEWLQAHRGQADLVLLDLGMPGMDGAACYARLRELEPGLRAVICSGYAEEGKVRDLLAAGAQGFVQKPYTAAELGTALAHALAAPARAGR